MSLKAEELPKERESAYAPPGPAPLMFEEFQGINTSTSRYGVDEKMMAWCDGWIPIGPKKLRTLPGVGATLFTASTSEPGSTVISYGFANIGASPVAIIFLSDGSIWQAQTDVGTITNIAPAGTILNPSRTSLGMSQWGSQYVIIVADQSNGYWLWDGVFLYNAGTLAPGVVVLNNGSGYSNNPTITAFGGSGSGATFSSTVAGGIVTGVSITAIGQGYQATDVVGLAFSGGGSAGRTAILTATLASGTLASVAFTDRGLGYTATTTASVEGGGGAGAIVAVTVAGGTVDTVSITNGGTGYLTTPTILVSDANNPVAEATVGIAPFGLGGTTVETYQGRVWIANGPTVTFSAPGSVVDFSTASGGGNFTSNDSFLRVGYTQLIQTNGFLYLIADSSINYISGVQTSGSPPTTTFTNQNADPEVGTPWPGTVDVFGRNILFANSFGAHVSYGAAVTKISDVLDGIYNSVAALSGFIPSAAKAIIYGKKVWMLLIPVIDKITGVQVNKLFMWNGKIWWSSQQDADLIYVQHQEINSVLTAWGTDGDAIFPLFQQASADFTKTVQSKFWAAPGGYQFTKTANRFWSMFEFDADSSITVTVEIDNENSSNPYTFTSPTNIILTKNASLVTIPVKNASSVTIPVVSVVSGLFITDPTAVGQQGMLTGMTISTDEPDISLISAMIGDQVMGYRG